MEGYPATETYPDYASALQHCGDGYDDPYLAKVTLAKTQSLLSRDLKIALYPPNTDATMTAVSLVAGKELRVLDFAGSLVPYFFMASQYLPQRYHWSLP